MAGSGAKPVTEMVIAAESFPLRGEFRIARGARTSAEVVTVELRRDGFVGRGECVPYARYGETIETVIAALDAVRSAVGAGADHPAVQGLMPAGAARNALDCALWDLAAKRAGAPVWRLAGLSAPRPVVTAYTISMDTPEAMADAARAAAGRPILKVKIGGGGDLDRIAAVADARPDARLIVDANEGMDEAALPKLLAAARDWRVEIIEQPFPADADVRLTQLAAPVAICADESFHVAADVERLVTHYDAVNIKLDKTGGLTEALRAAREAKAAGLKIMVGCMVGTSLGAAPAALLAQLADWVDLDGPLLLAADREPGLVYEGSTLQPAAPALWG
jgi:L-alanine-DL-glutamate epimerase-like enolase superfamily enzyme